MERWRRSVATGNRRVPAFDPADRGVAVRLLILLQTPGPGGKGPRLVSRDNPTGTARNLTRFLDEAGIALLDTILWNAVRWIVHAPDARTRALRRGENREGTALLPPFLALLPRLTIVMLAGNIAGGARGTVTAVCPDVAVLTMPHPSPTFVCTSPDIARRIATTLAEAAALLTPE